ncbi:MAG TPA: transposase [Paraburkholderia sp.]|uniref:transposase n=1 Tax=Paraburkholderia sp. TaxID=1926495 RepID=UPI002CD82626|nr:transposase [Paraburkholderia sp.]HTR07932.1 transposase [Paraburkholderia sp.]
MNFEELSDDEWMQVSSLVSDEPPIRLNRRGRPRAEPRVVANAVLWILTTGESWSRLPARYPSGPTCRRRFDDWHMSGTLIELVELLSQRGRKFVYVPQPAQADAQPVVAAIEEVAEDDGQPAVYWKSPEAWQVPAALTDAPVADAIESMTRQLAGGAPASPASFESPVTTATRSQPDTPFAPARMSKLAGARVSPREGRATGHRSVHAPGGAAQVAEWRGYTMNLFVQPVRNRMFRAAVEILVDGKRVERSGLIGPPFQDREAASNFAFDWAREWIEREGPAAPEAGALHAVSKSASQDASRSGPQNGSPNSLPGKAPLTPTQGASGVTRGEPSSAAVMRSLPTAVPGSVRLAPVQRYSATGTLHTGSEAHDANTAPSGSAERHPVGLRYRTLAR